MLECQWIKQNQKLNKITKAYLKQIFVKKKVPWDIIMLPRKYRQQTNKIK